MLKVTLLVVLVTAFAQVIPSCGGDQPTGQVGVIGWVEAKRVNAYARSNIVVINSVEYEVPGYFWSQVDVGDLVKWDGTTWTIVKKRGT